MLLGPQYGRPVGSFAISSLPSSRQVGGPDTDDGQADFEIGRAGAAAAPGGGAGERSAKMSIDLFRRPDGYHTNSGRSIR